MAQAAAAIGLIASIASLIDLGAKVASRLHAFESETADVPGSFRALAHRLPLLITTLHTITRQAQAGRLRDEVTTTLHSLLQSTTAQVSILETHLAQITPPTSATRIERTARALRRLTKDGKIRTAVDKVQHDIDFLLLHQTTQHIDTGGQILDALAELQLAQAQAQAQAQAPAAPAVSLYPNVSTHDYSQVHLGNIYHIHQHQELEGTQAYGLCWGAAPLIDVDLFVGRAAELDEMVRVLRPSEATVEQRRLVLGGLGGMGKTQLAIAYARRYQSHYASVFWLNATSVPTLKASVRSIAQQMLPVAQVQSLDDESALQVLLQWLSDIKNTSWLLIFDNYDDPELYNIEQYLPSTGHGSIIITTRLPDLVQGQQTRQTRSRRNNIEHDPDARRLVERLEGLPLALATAGAYLLKTTVTFGQYLEAYERRFNVNPRRPTQLQEYQDRTLYTTWNLSYSRLEQDDQLAAQTLRLLAYFDNQEIWYELLYAGLEDNSPTWLKDLAAEHIDFENVMGTLVDYCLVEAHPTTRSYSMHNCVHDWTLVQLNKTVSPDQYRYAVRCVVAGVGEYDWEMLTELHYARLARHASRLVHERFLQTINFSATSSNFFDQAYVLANLLSQQVQLSAAEEMYIRALAGREKALGSDHTSTLDTVNDLGVLYRAQGKLNKAEQMYLRALAGREKALGPDHTSTLSTLLNLANLRLHQGKLDEAEQKYVRVLAGYEKTLGPDHTLTLSSINSLGILYKSQGKLEAAKQMYIRALNGREKVLGMTHSSTLDTVGNLANLLWDQGKFDQAEQMYTRALVGKETALKFDYTSTLSIINNVGILYENKGNLAEAERMYVRALIGYEKMLGSDHTSTLDIVHNLGVLYTSQDRLAEAEQMCLRAVTGYEEALGSNHISTLSSILSLGNVYRIQDKLVAAEQMHLRALCGYEKVLGYNHTSTLNAVNNFGILYWNQGKLHEAEQMYQRALAGKEKILGFDHTSTLDTVHNLGVLYWNQNRLEEAEQMYARALAGYEKGLSQKYQRTRQARDSLDSIRQEKTRIGKAE